VYLVVVGRMGDLDMDGRRRRRGMWGVMIRP
jgi:hypothetical protein